MKSLQELNFSNNHISILPLSFAMLTGLEKLEMNENPWVVPPLDVVKRGKEAVLKCMIDLVAQEAKVEEAAEKSGMSSRISSVFKKKKSPGSAYKVKQRNDLLIRA
ncbi:plant intracellular Ras-group-related LRR protein 4-like [Physcomitrium patens]